MLCPETIFFSTVYFMKKLSLFLFENYSPLRKLAIYFNHSLFKSNIFNEICHIRFISFFSFRFSSFKYYANIICVNTYACVLYIHYIAIFFFFLYENFNRHNNFLSFIADSQASVMRERVQVVDGRFHHVLQKLKSRVEIKYLSWTNRLTTLKIKRSMPRSRRKRFILIRDKK